MTQPDTEHARLLRFITDYENDFRKWEDRAQKVIKRYRDERDTNQTAGRFNVLWSNTETLKPFLFSATPKPIVSRRIPDDEDPVSRLAAMALERALAFMVAEEHFGSTLRHARDDYLLAGRGTAWVRYVPQIEAQAAQPADDSTESEEPSAEKLVFEEVVADFVHWRDFGHNIARTWEEVDVVWRRVAMDRAALKKRFPETGDKIPLDLADKDRPVGSAKPQANRALIYEMWIKSEKRAVWLSKSWPTLLDDIADPLGLDHFFPCPAPIYATTTTDTLIPIPDYAEYQDQATELDDLTGRITALTKAIKATGVYDASVKSLERILQDGHDNTLIPVENWAGLTEKGGLAGAIEMLPMKEVAETLLQLYEAREKVKQDLYEITGMSDIIRGNTNPDETATAQNIKSHFATMRLDERQREMQRFARNVIDIMGNVIAVHFQPTTLAAMTGLKLLPADAKAQIQQAQAAGEHVPPEALAAVSQPSWDDVIALLRDQPRRRFRVDVETDSIVAPNDAQEQQARTQFLEAIGGFLQQAMQAEQMAPEMAPLLAQMLMFAVRGFRVGRDLEDDFEKFVDAMKAKAAQPQQPKPDPQMAKVQGELQLKQQQQQFDQQQQTQAAAHQQAMERSEALHRRRMEVIGHQNDAAKAQADNQADMVKAHIDAAQSASEARIQAMLEQWKAQLDAKTKIEVAEIAAGATLDAAEISAANQATKDAD